MSSEAPEAGNGLSEKHERTLHGDEHRIGLVQEISEMRGALRAVLAEVRLYRDEHQQSGAHVDSELADIKRKLQAVLEWMASRP